MRENKTLEKMLETIAEVFSESTSCFGLYEPKVPEKLVEKHKKNVQEDVGSINISVGKK